MLQILHLMLISTLLPIQLMGQSLNSRAEFSKTINELQRKQGTSLDDYFLEIDQLLEKARKAGWQEEELQLVANKSIWMTKTGQFKEAKNLIEGYLPYAESSNKVVHIQFSQLLVKISEKIGTQSQTRNYIEKLMSLIQGTSDKKILGGSYLAIAQSYQFYGEHKDAIFYYKEAQKLFESINDDYGNFVVFNSMANLFSELGQKKTALQYFDKALNIAKKRDDDFSVSIVLYNIGNIYTHLKEFNKAKSFLKRSLETCKKIKDEIGIAFASRELGSIFISEQKYEKAFEYLGKAINIFKKHNDWTSFYNAKFKLIDLLAKLKQFKMADKELSLLKNIKSKTHKISYYKKLYGIKKELGQWQEAIQALESYLDLEIETRDKEKKESIQELMTKFDVHNKDRENEFLKKQNSLQTRLIEAEKKEKRIAFVGVFFIASFLVIVLFLNRVVRQKNNSLIRQEAIISEQKKNLQLVLDNIQQGFVTIPLDTQESLRIHEISRYFFSIFQNRKKEDLISSDPLSYLFEGTNLNQDELSMIRSVLISSAGEPILQWQINNYHLPSEMILEDGTKTIEVDWAAIEEHDKVTKVVITFKDVSEIRALHATKLQNEIDLQKLSSLSLMDQKNYFLFISSATRMLKECQDSVTIDDWQRDHIFDFIIRNLHTIKGLSRSYELTRLSGFIHDLESYFSSCKTDIFTVDKDLCLLKLAELQEELESYRRLASTRLKWDHDTMSVNLRVSDLVEWHDTILDANKSLGGSEKLDLLIGKIKKKYSTSFQDTIQNIIVNSQKLSQNLGKGQINFCLEGCDAFVTAEFQDKIGAILIHLIRNSIDHGFLPMEERIKRNKPPPEINISLSNSREKFLIEVWDNGVGIHLDSILKKTGTSSNDNVDEIDIARKIFDSGLSTKSELSEISGRGMGMGAVKSMVESEGGGIELISNGKSRNGFLPVRFRITLPTKFFETLEAG